MMAIAAKCCLSAGKCAYSRAMDTIGPTAIPLSCWPLPTSAASRQLSMVRHCAEWRGCIGFRGTKCGHAVASEIILYAFDIMHLNGRDLRRLPLSERRSSGQTLAYVYGHADKHGIKEGGMLELMLHRGSVARDDSLNLRSSPREA
jgi:hypothetical protein